MSLSCGVARHLPRTRGRCSLRASVVRPVRMVLVVHGHPQDLPAAVNGLLSRGSRTQPGRRPPPNTAGVALAITAGSTGTWSGARSSGAASPPAGKRTKSPRAVRNDQGECGGGVSEQDMLEHVHGEQKLV